MPTLQRHFFVCQTNRPPSEGGIDNPSCGARGGAQLYSRLLTALDAAVKEKPELRGQVAVTACGCLDRCHDGPAMVVYPEGVWYQRLGEAELEEIIKTHLVEGRPVERLRWTER